jgi:bifunctional DNA-binding transcriptional regulator/antitoxin component of YhaV-PrlF toxin-antitoxin module
MPIVTLKTKTQITLPDKVAKESKLSVGDLLEVFTERGRVILTPKMLVDRKTRTRRTQH